MVAEVDKLFDGFLEVYSNSRKAELEEALNKGQKLPVKIDLSEQEIARREEMGFAPIVVSDIPLADKLNDLGADINNLLFDKYRNSKNAKGVFSVVWMRVVDGLIENLQGGEIHATVSELADYYKATDGIPFNQVPIFSLNPDGNVDGKFPLATKSAERPFFTSGDPNRCKSRLSKHLVVLKS